jgi:integrase
MNGLDQAVADYLTIRRALGYKLEHHGRLLPQFVDYLHEIGTTRITVEHAMAWAMMPTGSTARWWRARLSVVRGFALWLAASDPATEVPPADLLPCPRHRAIPYLYSDNDIAALLAAAGTIRSVSRAATYQTLIGLLCVTGMRIGEAISLDRSDLDLRLGLLVVRSGKFGKSRQLPLHGTTVAALRGYLELCDRLEPHPSTGALFISTVGTRLVYRNVSRTFRQLTQRAGLMPRSASRPRLHDLRHSFAVNTIIDGYRTGVDVQARLALLSTYLGHVDPANTYWYLSAAPELLALASERLDQHQGGQQ